MSDDIPLENGGNGRDSNGRFARGNAGGPGNPYVKKTAQWRNAMANAITAGDIRKIVKSMIRAAEGGDTQAARLLLDRCLGKPEQYLEVAGELGYRGAVIILPELEADDAVTQ